VFAGVIPLGAAMPSLKQLSVAADGPAVLRARPRAVVEANRKGERVVEGIASRDPRRRLPWG